MSHVIALLSLIVRLFRPVRGLHAAPRALRHEVREEARANRVRRYAANPGSPRPTGPGYTRTAMSSPWPVVDPRAVEAPAYVVRPYYAAWEAGRSAASAPATGVAA